MKRRGFLAADHGLVPVDAVAYVDTDHLAGEGYVDVLHDGRSSRVSGFFAIEAVMMLKPGALEGKRLRWHKRAWLMHNMVAHPLMQLIALAGDLVKPASKPCAQSLYRTAIRLHDATVPVPAGFHAKHAAQARLE